MCGIVGAIAKHNVATTLLEGLKRLEYRGYDSAGIIVINSDQRFERHRVLGKVIALLQLQESNPVNGNIGIAHTRWATHGKPSTQNAHPHIADNEIAIVHNGIIENSSILREQLLKQGCTLTSETDSELIAHSILLYLRTGQDILTAVRSAISTLEGTFAIGLIHRSEPDRLIAVRRGSPLVIGLGKDENYISSDQAALLSLTRKFIYLEDGDIADIYLDKIIIYGVENKPASRSVHDSHVNSSNISKGTYNHFMLKEIFEQPTVILSEINENIAAGSVRNDAFDSGSSQLFANIQRIQIVACGTSYHAGLVAKYWLEEIAGIPCQVEIASEYRYRSIVIEPNTLFITISQSGETADTLAALRLAKQSGYAGTLTICNVSESSIVRESDFTFLTNAGLEIGVASTKAFTTQLIALFLLTIEFGHIRGLNPKTETALIKCLKETPQKMNDVLMLNDSIKDLAEQLYSKSNAVYLARGVETPIALEGALKLKEISYIHAEAYPAGELKHGPIALIDSELMIIVIAPKDKLTEKLKSNLNEILARGGNPVIFTDKNSGIELSKDYHTIIMPNVDEKIAPVIYAVAMQLLAYHIAVHKGADIDQPRNLAKSVTVE